jgi:hypothetical protein
MKLETGMFPAVRSMEAESQPAKRMRVLLAARLVTKFNDRPVTIRDISNEGAMIEGGVVPSEGTLVVLQRGWIEVFATVAWSDGRKCGLNFETVLNDDDFLTFLNPPLPTGSNVEAPTRRHWRLRDDGPEEQVAGRAWPHATGRGIGRG